MGTFDREVLSGSQCDLVNFKFLQNTDHFSKTYPVKLLYQALFVSHISSLVKHLNLAKITSWRCLKLSGTVITLLILNNLIGLSINCIVFQMFSLVGCVFSMEDI